MQHYFVVTFSDDKAYPYILCDEDGQVISFETYGETSAYLKKDLGSENFDGGFVLLNIRMHFKIHRIEEDVLLGNFLVRPYDLRAVKVGSVLMFGLTLSAKDGYRLRARGIAF